MGNYSYYEPPPDSPFRPPEPLGRTLTIPADDARPNPLGDAARTAAGLWGAVSALLGVLATTGVLNAAQTEAIERFGSGVPGWLWVIGVLLGGALPAGGAVVAAFKTKAAALPEVTPAADPRAVDTITGELVPLVPYHGPVRVAAPAVDPKAAVEPPGGRHAKED